MYKEIIEFKEGIDIVKLEELKKIIIDAHDNYSGKVPIIEEKVGKYIFAGEDDDFGVLTLGYLELTKQKLFRDNVKIWRWEDTDEPYENHSILDAIEEVEAMQRKAV